MAMVRFHSDNLNILDEEHKRFLERCLCLLEHLDNLCGNEIKFKFPGLSCLLYKSGKMKNWVAEFAWNGRTFLTFSHRPGLNYFETTHLESDHLAAFTTSQESKNLIEIAKKGLINAIRASHNQSGNLLTTLLKNE